LLVPKFGTREIHLFCFEIFGMLHQLTINLAYSIGLHFTFLFSHSSVNMWMSIQVALEFRSLISLWLW
jgi:hypothetical protein